MSKITCPDPTCETPVQRRGLLCGPHRFWSRVIQHDGACWEWPGAHSDVGYGQMRVDNRIVYTHRFAYELTRGAVPEGLHLDHLCRNRGCCNPDHLEAVSKAENDRRGNSPLGLNFRKTHCLRGHEFDTANTYRPARGGRQCKACAAIRARRYQRTAA